MKSALGTKLNIDKLLSITTDGESANTGRSAGLWCLLEKELKRKLLTVWCACHRSDLALEDLELLIPEIKAWKLEAIASSSEIEMFYKGAERFWHINGNQHHCSISVVF